MLVGDADGNVLIYLNTANNINPEFTTGTTVIESDASSDYSRATPIVNDWNGDGKKDLLVGHMDGKIQVYVNEGIDADPVFTSSANIQVGGSEFDIGSRSAPRIYDWNHDGLKDILVGEVEGYVYYLKNVVSNDKPVFKRAEKLFLKNGNALRYPSPRGGPRSRLYIADWNNDGHDDILVGGFDGKVMVFLTSPVASFSLAEHLNKTLKLSNETLLKLKKMIKLYAKSLKNRLLN